MCLIFALILAPIHCLIVAIPAQMTQMQVLNESSFSFWLKIQHFLDLCYREDASLAGPPGWPCSELFLGVAQQYLLPSAASLSGNKASQWQKAVCLSGELQGKGFLVPRTRTCLQHQQWCIRNGVYHLSRSDYYIFWKLAT